MFKYDSIIKLDSQKSFDQNVFDNGFPDSPQTSIPENQRIASTVHYNIAIIGTILMRHAIPQEPS